MGLPVRGVTHSCVMRWSPAQKAKPRHPHSWHPFLLLPQLSAFLESLIPTNSLVRKPASVGLLVRWLDKCHMLPGKHPYSSLFHLSQQLAETTIKCYLMPVKRPLISFNLSATRRNDSLSAQLRPISLLPAPCANCSWGELHATTNTRPSGRRAVEDHLLHITSVIS